MQDSTTGEYRGWWNSIAEIIDMMELLENMHYRWNEPLNQI